MWLEYSCRSQRPCLKENVGIPAKLIGMMEWCKTQTPPPSQREQGLLVAKKCPQAFTEDSPLPLREGRASKEMVEPARISCWDQKAANSLPRTPAPGRIWAKNSCHQFTVFHPVFEHLIPCPSCTPAHTVLSCWNINPTNPGCSQTQGTLTAGLEGSLPSSFLKLPFSHETRK